LSINNIEIFCLIFEVFVIIQKIKTTHLCASIWLKQDIFFSFSVSCCVMENVFSVQFLMISLIFLSLSYLNTTKMESDVLYHPTWKENITSVSGKSVRTGMWRVNRHGYLSKGAKG